MGFKKGTKAFQELYKKKKNDLPFLLLREEADGRMDDGASRAYRKLGRAGYENYIKEVAPLWYGIPPIVERSGIINEASKDRLRHGPLPLIDDALFANKYPQAHYTLKILKTAYKIYRMRLEKRRHDRGINNVHFWQSKKREEEPKWAYIIDLPLLQQYEHLLQYIRDLAEDLAFYMGFQEVITSATPYRVLEKLHPLKRLDFRGAKHFLPKPFITCSNSVTQAEINRELKRLDTAVAKVAADKNKSIPAGMIAAEDIESSSTSSEGDDDEMRQESFWEELRENIVLSDRERKLLDRKGRKYVAYKDPGSEESLFVDFADVGQYVELNKSKWNLLYDDYSDKDVVREILAKWSKKKSKQIMEKGTQKYKNKKRKETSKIKKLLKWPRYKKISLDDYKEVRRQHSSQRQDGKSTSDESNRPGPSSRSQTTTGHQPKSGGINFFEQIDKSKNPSQDQVED